MANVAIPDLHIPSRVMTILGVNWNVQRLIRHQGIGPHPLSDE